MGSEWDGNVNGWGCDGDRHGIGMGTDGAAKGSGMGSEWDRRSHPVHGIMSSQQLTQSV